MTRLYRWSEPETKSSRSLVNSYREWQKAGLRKYLKAFENFRQGWRYETDEERQLSIVRAAGLRPETLHVTRPKLWRKDRAWKGAEATPWVRRSTLQTKTSNPVGHPT